MDFRNILPKIIIFLFIVFLFAQNAVAGVSLSFVYNSQFGTEGTGNGQFSALFDVNIDNSGNIYVTDANNSRVQKFSNTGVYISQFGSSGSGNGEFNSPFGVAFDSSNNVYVTDQYNHRVQIFDSNGTYISQFGTAGSGNGQFNTPSGIAIDSSNNIYVADLFNNRIQKFDSAGNYITKWGIMGAGNGQFNSPYDVAVDNSGNVYVNDYGNYRIQKFDIFGNYISKFGTSGTGNGELDGATGIAIDSLSNIYVSDSNNNRIQKFDNSGNYLFQFGTSGSGNDNFTSPYGLVVNSSNNVFVADLGNNRIVKLVQADTEPPLLLSSNINSSTITLTYDETLDPGSLTSVDSFTVMVDGSSRSVLTSFITGSTVILTISPAVLSTNTVLISYVVPIASYRTQDLAGNDAVAFTDQAVTNTTPVLIDNTTTTSGGVSAILACHDVKALNYNAGGISAPSTCLYPTKITETNGVCTKYITVTKPIAYGNENDIEIVKKIEEFLNTKEGNSLVVDGIYGLDDVSAVKKFQEKYALQILSPWGENLPTGIVYITTSAKINAVMCAELVTCPYFTILSRQGDTNNDVPRIKSFLNLVMGSNLDTSSKYFDADTTKAVRSFQSKYADFVLKPWGIDTSTGLWFQTTSRQANKFSGCLSPAITLPNGVVMD